MSEEKQIELENCPYCGSSRIEQTSWNLGALVQLECDGCRFRSPRYSSYSVAVEKWNTRAENPRIAALESDLEYLNRWKTLIESAPEFEVQKIAVERFLKTDGMRPFLAHFKTRIKELETENERLSAEVEKWKRLAGKKAI